MTEAPNKAGVYFIKTVRNISLGFDEVPPETVVYIGKSKCLKDRKIKNYFSSDGTGFSTLRRSLGAILKEELGLKCFARGKGNTKQDINCYIFDKAGEEKLTAWMKNNLTISFEVVEDISSFKDEAIRLNNPRLNLTKVDHKHIDKIKELREMCREEASKNGSRL